MSERLEAGSYRPTGEFVWRQPVRAYEPGANGRLGPGNLLRYCEWVANAASAAAGFGPRWYAERREGWVVYRTTLELGAPVGNGESLDLMTWVAAYTRVSAQRGYRLTHAASGATVARALTTWAFVDRERQTPKRIPPEILAQIPRSARVPLPERRTWGTPPSAPFPPAGFALQARGYEADVLQHVNNCVYADWLSEAARLALAGWGDRLPAAAWLPRRLRLTYLRSAVPGDDIVITTTLAGLGARGVTLDQTAALRADPAAPLVTARAAYLAAPALARG